MTSPFLMPICMYMKEIKHLHHQPMGVYVMGMCNGYGYTSKREVAPA